MKIINTKDQKQLTKEVQAFIDQRRFSTSGVQQIVSGIIEKVRLEKDSALLSYTQNLDKNPITCMEQTLVSKEDMQQALDELDVPLRESLEFAHKRIYKFHAAMQLPDTHYQDELGATLRHKHLPLERVGVYVPGGQASYPSTVLMNAIPAKVAGVRQVVMVTPRMQGVQNKLVIAAAKLAGVDRVIEIGGAQSVAALAYGTPSVPRVDKIVGPGNIYVAEAKRQVFGLVGIDSVAGPSEVCIIAQNANPDWVALDMFAQAEHDENAQAIVITPEKGFREKLKKSIDSALPNQARKTTIEASLANNGCIIEVEDLDTACRIANLIAPEHLELAVDEPESLVPDIRCAGAVFLGHHCNEVLGDYVLGSNHVLPTFGSARFSSGLSVYDFMRSMSIASATPEAARKCGEHAARLADAEGLFAHAGAARLRGG